MKELRHLILELISLLILIAMLVSLVRADIISVNAGGSTNITVTPDLYSEGSFGDPVFGPGEVPGEEGGESGGEEGGVITGFNLSITPAEFDLDMIISTNVPKTLSITNIGTTTRTVAISQSGLDNMVIIGNTSISLDPGQTAIISLIFVAPGIEGVYTGSILAGGLEIPVRLNVLEEFILFDSNIVVLNDNYKVPQGDTLETEVTMIPMGGPVRMDVTLEYTLKDANGTVFLTKSETLLVEEQKSIRRDFDTGGLPLGRYIVELDLIYPYGVAPSSAHFDVVESEENIFSLVIYWIIFMIIVVLVLLIIVIMIRTLGKMRQNIPVNSQPVVSAY